MGCGKPLPATSSSVALVILIAGTGTGAAIDLVTRRIPNVVVAVTAAAGVLAAAGGASDISFGSSLVGLAVGIMLMLTGHLLGATGAGDVKLFGAVGAAVGVERIMWAFGYTAIAGGVFALIWALHRGRLTLTLHRVLGALGRPGRARATIVASAHNRFPYGPAIAVGSVLAVFLRG